MKTKVNEKERIEKYLRENDESEFSFKEHNKHIKLIKRKTLKDVELEFSRAKFRKTKCYLYHFDKLGITDRNVIEDFTGKKLLVYRSNFTRTIRMRKCPWCYIPTDNLEEHIKIHKKNIDSLYSLKFQQYLYSELLRIVRETPYYLSMMFMNSGCQMCDNPVMEGRELCCSIPTSFRNRVRSLKIMGLRASNLPEKYVLNKSIGQILLAP